MPAEAFNQLILAAPATFVMTPAIAVAANDAIFATGAAAISESFAAVGTANAWNPVGWVCLAIAAIAAIVLVYYYWDEICDFFSWLWGETKQIATIVWDWTTTTAIPGVVDTATDIWNSLTFKVDYTLKKAEKQAKKLAAALAAAATTLIPKDEEVYRIDMIKPGIYKKLNWGLPYEHYHFPCERGGDPRYKYGTTKNGVNGRYTVSSYIGRQLFFGNMSYIIIRGSMNYWEARILEKMLISFYFKKHGAFPPGNSKLG